LRCPVLAIQSTARDFTTLKRRMLKQGETSPWLDYLKSRGARVEIVPDVGHFTQIEAPDVVNRLIGNFIRTA
jgi:pimeloyl-ACP methyl ester carboxylesterase